MSYRGLALALALVTSAAFAQSGPNSLNISGGLFNSSGTPITNSNVNFKIEVYDKNATCLMYSEQHLGVDLSATKGAFSLIIGAGTSITNVLEGTTSFDSKLFENPGAVAAFTGCPSGLTLNAGDSRLIRVSYNLGSGYVAMTPDIPLTSSAYAMVAETLNGHSASDFVLTNVNSSLSQVNVEYAFSNTNWPTLKSLIDGTSGEYIPSTPTSAVGFNSQRLTNVANPTGAQDAATKSYTDANLGGQLVDMTGVAPGMGGGKILTWDQTAGKWVAGSTGAVGLVASGTGLTGGPITSSGTLSVDVGTAANKILQLDASARIPAVNGSLLTNINAVQLQGRDISAVAPGSGNLLGWNATTNLWEATPNPGGTVTGLTGDVSGSGAGVISTTINANSVTSAKINNTGIAVNRLLITDGTTGATVGYSTCALGEVLQWSATGWKCESVSLMLGNVGTAGTYGNPAQVAQVTVDATGRVTNLTNVNINFPVLSVNGHTGVVSLIPSDITGLGTAAVQNVGLNSGNVVQLMTNNTLPALDGSQLTNLNVGSSQWLNSGSNIYYNLGNVGVGTTSPTQALTVSGNLAFTGAAGATISSVGSLNLSPSTGSIYVSSGIPIVWGSGTSISGTTNGPLLFNPAGTERMRIDNLGNVGIGTTTPNYKLDVAGTVNASALMINGVAVGTTSSPWQFTGSDIYYNTGRIGVGTASPAAAVDVVKAPTGTSGSVLGAGQFTTNYQPGSAPAGGTQVNNVFTWLNTLSTADLSNVTALGGNYTVQHLGGSNINTAIGFQSASSHAGTGSMTQAVAGQYMVNNTNTGTITNAIGVNVSGANSGGGTITNSYGLQLGTIPATNRWGVYQIDASDKNYFAGSVGIGTTTPGANLDVAGTINASAITINGVSVGTSSSPWLLSGTNAYYNGGNVGIGTTSPGTALDVNGDIRSTHIAIGAGTPVFWDFTMFKNNGTASGMAPAIVYKRSNTGNANGIELGYWADGATDTAGAILSPSQTGDLILATNPGGTATDRLHITNAGNVGIGTASPSGILDVEGGTAAAGTAGTDINIAAQNGGAGVSAGGYVNIRAGNGTTPGGITLWGASSVIRGSTDSYVPVSNAGQPVPAAMFGVGNGWSADGNNAIMALTTHNAATNAQSAYFGVTSTAGTAAPAMVWGNQTATGYAERIRLDPTGNVGIGTTTPGAKLDVAGTINASALTINGVSVGTSSSPWSQSGSNIYYNMGNVGIGSASPIYPLDIQTGTTQINVESNQADIRLKSTDNNLSSSLSFENQGLHSMSIGLAGNGNGLYGGSFFIDANNDNTPIVMGNNGGYHFAVDSTGNVGLGGTITATGSLAAAGLVATPSGAVGIGTTSVPWGVLEVNGGAKFDSAVYVWSNLYNLAYDTATYSPSSSTQLMPQTYPALTVGNSDGNTPGEMATIVLSPQNNSSNVGAYITAIQPASGHTPAVAFGQATGATAYQERMRIHENGNIGIGTTTPNYTLDVNGTINASNLKVNGVAVSTTSSPWALNGTSAYYNGGFIGVGTTTPDAIISASLGPGAQPANIGSMIHTTGATDVSNATTMDAFGSHFYDSPYLTMRKAHGTAAAPTASQVNDILGEWQMFGWTGSGWTNTAAITINALENYDASHSGSNMLFITTKTGTNSQVTNIALTGGGAAFNGNYAAANPVDVNGAASIGTAYAGVKVAPANGLIVQGNVGIGTPTPQAVLEIASTTSGQSAIIVPRDTTANRPSGVNGMIRYNTDTASFESYANGSWAALGSGSSLWSTNGSGIFYNSGLVGIGTTSQLYQLDLRTTTPKSQIHMSATGADDGLYLNAYNANTGYMTTGVSYVNGSGWVPKATSASILEQTGGMTAIYSDSSLTPGTAYSPTAKLQVNNSGTIVSDKLMVGYPGNNASARIQAVESTGTSMRGILSSQFSSDSAGSSFVLSKARGTYGGTVTTINNGDYVGSVVAEPYDGSSYLAPALAGFIVNGTVSTGTVPVDFVIQTGSSGTAGGAEALRVTSSGNVGIGTATPQALLDIQTTTSGLSAILIPRDTTANRPPAGVNGMIRYNTSTAAFEGFANGAWGSLASGGSSQWTTSGSNIYYNLGNVGIGTTNPNLMSSSNLMNIYTTDFSGQLMVNNSNSTSDRWPAIQARNAMGSSNFGGYPSFILANTRGSEASRTTLSSGDTLGRLSFMGYDGSTESSNNGPYIQSQTTETWGASAHGSNLQFATTANGTSGHTVAMTIDQSGNVGIGTTTPTASLEVNGRAKFRSGVSAAVRVITAAGAVTVTTSDYIICVKKSVGAATTVNLPASPSTGDQYIIKDCNGDAATNNITVVPAAGNIDGSGTYVMTTNRQSIGIFYDGSQWEVF